MDKVRRTTLIALALAALGGARPGQAQQPGMSYTTLKPALPVNVPGKIEVLEFFWYGCIHCFNLEAALEPWLKGLAADVQFRRVPAIFNPRWGHDAAIHFSLEAMGVLEKLHRPLFNAIHVDRLRTDDAKALGGWLQKQGVDAKRFDEVIRSFGVQSKVRQAQQLTVAYGIEGTPAMAVHGRYTVSPEQGGSPQGVLAVVDHLVNLTRRSLSAKG